MEQLNQPWDVCTMNYEVAKRISELRLSAPTQTNTMKMFNKIKMTCWIRETVKLGESTCVVSRDSWAHRNHRQEPDSKGGAATARSRRFPST